MVNADHIGDAIIQTRMQSFMLWTVQTQSAFRFQKMSCLLCLRYYQRTYAPDNLQEDSLRDACLLVFANKQDLPGAMNDTQISEALGLAALKNRQWAIFKTSAIKGQGIYEGLDWYQMTFNSLMC